MRGNPLSLIDPLGLAERNFFNQNERGGQLHSGVEAWHVPGAYTEAGHGNP
jgi:hypothetical protein